MEMKTFDVGRLAAFTDGVFAIAITLLVLDLDLPDVSGKTIGELIQADLPKFYSWLISFLALGTLWLHHHYIVAHLRCTDITILLLNLALLLFISVTPWTTSLIGAYGDQSIAVVLFSGCLGLAWLSIALIGLHARKHGLLLADASKPEPGLMATLVTLRGTLVAVLSIGLAYVDTTWAVLVWVLLFVMHPFVYRN
jgi:uncharacterized membrane protein